MNKKNKEMRIQLMEELKINIENQDSNTSKFLILGNKARTMRAKSELKNKTFDFQSANGSV